MALRAKEPIEQPNRFRALVYGGEGAGKSHFSLSIPQVYYIDTENVMKYPHFRKMLKDNKGKVAEIVDLEEIINEVKELLNTKHDYKTLVIDSVTFPYTNLGNLEVERLIKGKVDKEGTEFGANMAKPKRLAFHLAMLLTRLDMNVIVIAHEKIKYSKGEEVGKMADISEKMGYSLGAILRIQKQGQTRKLYVEKSRYDEFGQNEVFDIGNTKTAGYDFLKGIFGEENFLRESVVEILATPEQINELNRLIQILNYPEEKVQKWLSASKSNSLDEMKTEHIQKCIDLLKNQVTQPGVAANE